ncbi:tRNA pseudouridine(38-40) synthase TruA [Halomarina oriensis]|uniref:tRNA pseudouridine synthase A n=1 Tax=Halomarina oriensis TaxID=671145 RepID=A0A6B0GFU2_9EURY|nr:tRNA pseudouridine(38-40) synthase TruA [Halomarina oriensis]MWG33692.1 tRNA pseudouridine(38-40) synthase TruA [Halomarina oriensis]
MKRAFRVAYDGTAFRGFQRQPDARTVERTLFDALARLGVYDGERFRPPGYAAAGRTDAGVSALAQTVAFDCPAWCTPRAVNSELPADVRAWASAEVPEAFHATHDATEREYTYHLHAPDADAERAREALDRLAGSHDFHNLTPDDAGTERTLDAALSADGPFLVVVVRADGFPRSFVRRLATLVGAVGTGVRAPPFVDRVLSDERLGGGDAVGAAPPEPLVLTDVTYPDLAFERDEDAAESAHEVFETRRVDHETSARVAARLRDGVGPP